MADDADAGNIQIKKGRPMFSWAIVAAAVVIAGSGVAQWLTLKFGQEQLLAKLTASDEALKSNEQAVEANSEAITDLTKVMGSLQVDVNAALNDRWTETDEKFYGLETMRFWSDFQRMNPALVIPGWPEPKRVTDHDGGK